MSLFNMYYQTETDLIFPVYIRLKYVWTYLFPSRSFLRVPLCERAGDGGDAPEREETDRYVVVRQALTEGVEATVAEYLFNRLF